MKREKTRLLKRILGLFMVVLLTVGYIPIQAEAAAINVTDSSVADWKPVTSSFSDPYGDVNGAGPNDIVKLWVTTDEYNFYVRWDIIMIGNNTDIKSSAYSIAMTTAVSDPGSVRPAKEVIGYVAFDSQSRITVFLENSTKKVQLPSDYARAIKSGSSKSLVSIEAKFPFTDFNSNGLTKNPISSTSVIPLWGQSLSSPSFNSSAKDSVPNTGYLSYDIMNNTSTPRGTGPIPSLSVITTNTNAAPSSNINYIVTVSNKGDVGDLTLSSVDFTLPSGFSYIPGSSTGMTSSDPSGTTGTISWAKAEYVSPGQSAVLTFKARASSSAGTYYSYAAVACTSPSGSIESGDTAAVNINSAYTAPAAPSGLTADNITQNSAVLTWIAPDAGTYSYNLYESGILKAADITSPTYTVTDLVPGTSHNFSVTAVNISLVESPESSSVSFSTLDPVSVPGAPVLKAIAGRDGMIDIAWSPVEDAASYKVYISQSQGSYGLPAASGLTSTGYTASGLANGTEYYFIVKAANSRGDSEASNELSAIPVAPPSQAPVLNAISPSYNGDIQLQWSGVAGATGYNIYQYSKSGSIITYTPVASGITDTSYTINGMANGTYSFCVSASNSAGESPKSAVQNATVSIQLPAAPVLKTASATGSNVTLTWDAASYAVSYKVYTSTSSRGTYNLAGSDIIGTSYTVEGLTSGTPYFFVVRSSNPAGDSPYSNELRVVPDSESPIPGNSGTLAAGNPTSGSIDLSWSAASDTVTAEASLLYKVVYSTENNIGTVLNAESSGTTAQDWTAGITNKRISGLAPNTTYYFNVIVKDTAGNKTVYSTAAGTTLTASQPPDPISLTYLHGANGTISGSTAQVVEAGLNGTEVEAVPDAGYHFTGWSDGITTAKRTDTSVSSNITVTASFAINTYVVSFIMSGGSTVPPQSINHGAKAVKPSDPTKSGYNFAGWYKEALFANVFDFDTETVTGNIPVYAKWSQIPASGSGNQAPPSQPTTVTGDVIDGGTGNRVSNVTAAVTEGSDGSRSVSMNAADTVVLKEPNGSTSMLADTSKLAVKTESGMPVVITPDGKIQVEGLSKGTDNNFNITYDLGNGQIITIGRLNIKVDDSGNVSLTSTLIDPYGVVTDEKGSPVEGVRLTLYYADTERNRASGKTPGTLVQLPEIDGFKPNNNKNPQVSDGSGAYGFMVFPNSDYYVTAEKDGYIKYTSPVISVEQELVKWNFRIHITGVERLYGLNRVDTAIAIAKAAYPNTISNIILATADNYPDALAGSVLAYKLNAPILLVGSSGEDQGKVLSYMKENMDLKGNVYILGGTGAVNGEMESKVMSSGFSNILRLGGYDRYGTSARIADRLGVKTGTPVVIVSGENYPDALSISSTAAVKQYPVLLVTKDGISEAVRDEILKIKPSRIYIIGLQGAVSNAVEDKISSIASLDRVNVIRIGGTDRYKTSVEAARYFNMDGDIVCIATGFNFPDALAGSIYGALNNAPIILADGRLEDEVLAYLKERKFSGATIFGGEYAVGKVIFEQVSGLTVR